MTRNQPASIQLLFRPQGLVQRLSTACHAYAAGMWIPWSLGAQANVCQNLLNGGVCPIQPNQNAIYGFQIRIPRIAPVNTRVVVQLRATTPDRNTVFCVRINVLVVK